MAQAHVPLKLRKQMLLMRAAVERVELAHHLSEVRRAATFNAIVRNALPGDRSRSWVARAFEVAKRYPFITSAASLVAARFKLPILKGVVKWGGVATLAYKLWELWQERHPSSTGSSVSMRVAAARRRREGR
jgi:threonine/homoserine/homoserine lactone efflux protein